MKKLSFPLALSIFLITITSCGDGSGISDLGRGEAPSKEGLQYTISAPVEVVVGEPYSISLVNASGEVASGLTRLVIKRDSTQISDTEKQDIALYSHTPDQASVGKILNYTIYHNGNKYFAGSLVIAPEQ